MTQTLRNFISAREGEVKASIKALNDELRELRAAKSAIDGGSATTSQRSPSSRVTHRDMIVAVLDDHPEGGTSDRVIEWIKEKYETEIPQASMSSQLSRAKSDGLLELDTSTKIWKSAKHSEANVGLQSVLSQNENPAPAGAGEAETESAGGAFGVPNPQQWPRSQ